MSVGNDGGREVRESLLAVEGRLHRLEASVKKSVTGAGSRIEEAATRINETATRINETGRRLGDRLDRHMTSVEPGFHEVADDVIATGRTLMGRDRLYTLWQAVRNVHDLALPSVEVGVYRGGSALFLAKAFSAFGTDSPHLVVFDSFEGHLVEDVTEFDPHHRPGLFADTAAEEVAALLAPYLNVRVVRSAFPQGAAGLPDGPIGLAHLDTDLYVPTRDSLLLLGERMPPGAVIVIDDYGSARTPGVVRAVTELRATDRLPFQLWDPGTEQAMLVRRP